MPVLRLYKLTLSCLGQQDFALVRTDATNLADMDTVQIVRGLNDGVDYIRKSWISSDHNSVLDDRDRPNEVVFTAPDFPAQYFPELVCWNEHSTEEDRAKYQRRWSMVTRYYNGGTLVDYVDWCRDEYLETPEWFIWLVVKSLARAIAFMLAGWRDGQRLPATWTPIMQRDLAISNIFIHWDNYTDQVPRVILGDFGFGARETDQSFPRGLAAQKVEELYDELQTWEDIQCLGTLLARLVGMFEPDTVGDDWFTEFDNAIASHDHPPELKDDDPRNENPNEAYSEDLIDLITMLHLSWDQKPGDDYCDVNRIINEVIPLADRKFNELQDQIDWRSIKGGRPAFNNKIFWVQSPVDLIRKPQPYWLYEVSPDINNVSQLDWLMDFELDQQTISQIRTPWLHPTNPERHLRSDVDDGEPIQILEGVTQRGGWVTYLVRLQGQTDAVWLKASQISDKGLLAAFYMRHPEKRRGRGELEY